MKSLVIAIVGVVVLVTNAVVVEVVVGQLALQYITSELQSVIAAPKQSTMKHPTGTQGLQVIGLQLQSTMENPSQSTM